MWRNKPFKNIIFIYVVETFIELACSPSYIGRCLFRMSFSWVWSFLTKILAYFVEYFEVLSLLKAKVGFSTCWISFLAALTPIKHPKILLNTDVFIFLRFEALKLKKNRQKVLHKNPGDSIILANLQNPNNTVWEI